MGTFFEIVLFLSIVLAGIYVIYRTAIGVGKIFQGRLDQAWSDPGFKVGTTFTCAGLTIWAIWIYQEHNPKIAQPSAERVDQGESSMAFIQCKDFVSDKLKAPDSADFPILDFQAFRRGQDTYAVRSYVDSQNSFGAKIRADFFCEVKWNGENHAARANWQLLQLEITERK